ncbi:MAG: hypothetical protein JAZ17_17810 [Candidatus Thiodiazotropha endolucinida]|nr:hypothetical protein [Candidatus Thiodiazotropha taylori]MCG7953163.1 hypothetical protein [Candidatus Thiodiazotropha taylori]MCG8095446.1 hypothetical protein [Candidatus Thiodiazotropha endolucinida]MCW4268589.1 hypothetical protein [Candidatus Thiodiazotropha endolucinida]MCW4270839.1 hypothetical protein [Candidatus Thiodiazotropha endolucinida]
MGFQFSQFALFAAFIIGFIAFSAYNIRTARRIGFSRYLVASLCTAKAIIVAMSKLVIGVIGFLSSSADTSEEEEGDTSAGAYRGGTLNYRTGKLDDGTDPYGWYETD